MVLCNASPAPHRGGEFPLHSLSEHLDRIKWDDMVLEDKNSMETESPAEATAPAWASLNSIRHLITIS